MEKNWFILCVPVLLISEMFIVTKGCKTIKGRETIAVVLLLKC